jgi:hypothetical protein
MTEGVKVNRLLIGTESAKGCGCQLAKLGSSAPESQLKGRGDSEVVDIE